MSLMWMLHGDYSEEISTEEAIKMSPSCRKWQTLCWFMLKAFAIYKYFAVDQKATFWITVVVSTPIIIIFLLMLKLKVMTKRTTMESMSEEATDLTASVSNKGSPLGSEELLSGSSNSEVSLTNHHTHKKSSKTSLSPVMEASKKLQAYIEAKHQKSDSYKVNQIPIWRW
ncbi:uncharacterized protein LOC116806532 [Drosophila grimshawi]|uniref:uncharacterized protein LOC116806532 n=1 Tax=Drosophila grimshawi TaxID=7222 RepID=UPI000C870037|nr:uncharacterized protein LOC116806532 [Drosophila grimshawi]